MKNQNIDNLTSLWILAAESFDGYKETDGLHIIKVDFSDWPNKVWHSRPDDIGQAESIKGILKESATKLTYTKWESLEFDEQRGATDLGFTLKSVQIGMSLNLHQYNPPRLNDAVDLTRVTSEKDPLLWSDIFRQCFNYIIPARIITSIGDKISFYVISDKTDTVGCVATFVKDNQIGVHSLGVLDKHRKKGLAESVMHILLSDTKCKGLTHAHLQASASGLGIYRRIGFEEIFKMCNYQL